MASGLVSSPLITTTKGSPTQCVVIQSMYIGPGREQSLDYFDMTFAGSHLQCLITPRMYISPGSEWIEIDGTKKHVKSYLSDFLFAPERCASPISSLSGGERNRLLLARLFARPANVLVLDEPTNDLDIETLELLEQLLSDYPGTIFLVSHDRAFLDNVVTSLIVSEGDGFWREYEGGYEDWKIQKSRSDALTAKVTAPASKAPVQIEEKSKTKPVVQKLNSKERQELEDLPGKIDALEHEQADLGHRLADSNLYSSNMDLVKQYQARLGEIEHSLMQLMARWEALAQKSN